MRAEDPLHIKGTMLDNRYQIVGLLGVGGMGVVYLAKQDLMNRLVAVKILPATLIPSGDPEQADTLMQRFIREAQLSIRIKHPHVVEVFDLSRTDDGSLYIAMEYLEGRTLRHMYKEENLPGLQRTLKIFYQVLEGVDAAHKQSITHRDLKPENIFLVTMDDQPDFVKILDFGLAKISQIGHTSGVQLTRHGQVLGTVWYMSPEQARGDPVDHRTDIYALGAILYEMISGTAPFEGNQEASIQRRILTEAPMPLLERCKEQTVSTKGIPFALEAVVMRTLQKDPNQRYQSIAEFETALHEAMEDRQIKPPSEHVEVRLEALPDVRKTTIDTRPATMEPGARPTSWKRVLAIGAGTALLAGTIAFLTMRRPVDKPAPASTPPTAAVVVAAPSKPPPAPANPGHVLLPTTTPPETEPLAATPEEPVVPPAAPPTKRKNGRLEVKKSGESSGKFNPFGSGNRKPKSTDAGTFNPLGE